MSVYGLKPLYFHGITAIGFHKYVEYRDFSPKPKG